MEVSIKELEGAIIALRCKNDNQMAFPYWNANTLARNLMEYVREHKEPAWEAGDIVQAADEKFYKRTYGGKWQRFGVNAAWGHEQPKRPLVKIGHEKYV